MNTEGSKGPALFLALAGWLLWSAPVLAVQIEELDPGREWRVKEITISGNEEFSDGELSAEMLTEEPPWYLPWADRPVFDPATLKRDLERLRRFYEARGYYKARLTYDLEVDESEGLLGVHIMVEENRPVVVSEIEVEVADDALEKAGLTLPEKLPLERSEIFNEQEYQESEQALREFFLERGYAHVETRRRAQVDLDKDQVRVRYSVRPGPPTVFGPTEVTGADKVDPVLVSRELTYAAGEPFSSKEILESRREILGLDLFSEVRIRPKEVPGKPTVVPMEVRVAEKPPREIKIQLGYSTEEEFRTQFEWAHRNWLGGGRRLSLVAEYSSIILTGAVNFVQPHFPTPRSKAVIGFRHDREDEETFLLNATRFRPYLEHRFSEALTGVLGYRLEYNSLDNVASATIDALGDVERDGILSGPALGLIWDTTDDPFYPKKGEIISFLADQGGAVWGGRFSFYKLRAEAKKYLEIGWETVLAGRLKIGLADSIGSKNKYPLFERFYAGGVNSVRGFERRRLGPLSAADDPLGGLSLIEGSLEVRRPLWGALGGALFLDFGQVSLRSFDVPLDDVKFAAGFGLSYTTPVGPMRLDVGFPFDPPPGDRFWQIHFSIGGFF